MKVRILSPLKYDRLYAVGEVVDLPDEIVETLPAGTAELSAAAAEPPEGGAEVLGRFKVLAPFQYQGEKYAEGDVVELPIEEARKREEKLEKLND